jgi:DNA-binding IclR family transcriptional regulator
MSRSTTRTSQKPLNGNPLVKGQLPRAATPAPAKKAPYAIESLNRAIDILSAFDHTRPELSLNEIMEITGLAKTTAFRMMVTLVDRHLCDQDLHTGLYSLGFAMLHFAEIRRRQARVRDLAMPVMRDIRDQINETVVLSIRCDDYRVHIDAAEGFDPMRRMPEPGVRVPLYVGAASKVLLSAMSELEVDSYFNRTALKPFQRNTITSPAVLKREMRMIRRNGYAESRSELILGCAAMAVPIKDYTGQTVAVIDVLTPEGRYTPAFRQTCLRLLTTGARRISERLGLPTRPATRRVRTRRRSRQPV